MRTCDFKIAISRMAYYVRSEDPDVGRAPAHRTASRVLCQTVGAPQSSYPRCLRCCRRHRDDLRGRAAHLLYTVIRGVPKARGPRAAARGRTTAAAAVSIQAGNLALGATPAGRDDAGADFVSVGRRGIGCALCVQSHCHIRRRGVFPELRFIEKHTTCNDLTLLRGPHPAVQKGGLPVRGARG